MSGLILESRGCLLLQRTGQSPHFDMLEEGISYFGIILNSRVLLCNTVVFPFTDITLNASLKCFLKLATVLTNLKLHKTYKSQSRYTFSV